MENQNTSNMYRYIMINNECALMHIILPHLSRIPLMFVLIIAQISGAITLLIRFETAVSHSSRVIDN